MIQINFFTNRNRLIVLENKHIYQTEVGEGYIKWLGLIYIHYYI